MFSRGLQTPKNFGLAIGESKGEVLFGTHHQSNYVGNQHGSFSLSLIYDDSPKSRIRVKTDTLDNVLTQFKRSFGDEVLLLKVDTEGFDQLVFYGAPKTLERTEMVLWECHELQKRNKGGPGTTLFESVSYLKSFGFQTFLIGLSLIRLDGGLYHPEYDSLLQWQNCFSIKAFSKFMRCLPLFNSTCAHIH